MKPVRPPLTGKTPAERIPEAMKHAGLDPEIHGNWSELGRRVGVDGSTVQRWTDRGKHKPSVPRGATLMKLAAELGYTPQELLGQRSGDDFGAWAIAAVERSLGPAAARLVETLARLPPELRIEVAAIARNEAEQLLRRASEEPATGAGPQQVYQIHAPPRAAPESKADEDDLLDDR